MSTKEEPLTCPQCGALVVPQLARCRRCGRYLHGTAAEGWLIEFLPAPLRAAPGTGVAILFILVYYALAVVLAGPRNLVGFSSYTLVQMGAITGPALLRGESWRYVTYMFGHHDLVHLGFNLAALVYAGPIVEELFERKKMFLLYVATGVAGGLAAYAYYVLVRGGAYTLFVSAGASGAVSGLIGAALVGARRHGGPEARAQAERMKRWTITLVIWGLVPGINNAAHAGGWIAGAALAAVLPLGLPAEAWVGSSRVDLQACKLEYSIVSPK